MVMRVGQDVGNYRLLTEISHGETAIIYQAVHHIMTNRLVALKLLYACIAVSIQERKSIICSSGHSSSQGIEPSSSRSRIL